MINFTSLPGRDMGDDVSPAFSFGRKRNFSIFISTVLERGEFYFGYNYFPPFFE